MESRLKTSWQSSHLETPRVGLKRKSWQLAAQPVMWKQSLHLKYYKAFCIIFRFFWRHGLLNTTSSPVNAYFCNIQTSPIVIYMARS